MKRKHQYQPVVIADFESAVWPHPIHKHNHFELIYIKHGKGLHIINQVTYDYHDGSIYLLGPEDEHYFKIKEQTRFVYLKFTDLYLYKNSVVVTPRFQILEYVIKNREIYFSGFELPELDKNIIKHIFDLVISLKDDSVNNEELIWLQVLAIAMVLQRNLPELKQVVVEHGSKDMQAIFFYLHKHIYTPEKLKASVFAAHFNTTANYIGPYFKRNTGVTLREYIRDYRKTLINRRIDSGRYSLKEIAVEFGLTDESHVTKIINS